MGRGELVAAAERVRSQLLIVSFSTDWLYPPRECRELAMAVCRHRPATYVMVPSNYGHDAFLVETEEVGRLIRNYLTRRNGQ